MSSANGSSAPSASPPSIEDGHVEVDKHYNSAPYSLLREKVWVRLTPSRRRRAFRASRTVEIFHLCKRVAAHVRTSSNRQHTTISEHMPASHRRHSEWSPERLKSWAAKIGLHTATLVEVILRDRSHPGQGSAHASASCDWPSHTARSRWKRSERALVIGARSYSSVNSILKTSHWNAIGPRELPAESPSVRGPLATANAPSQPARSRSRRARDPARQYPSCRLRASGTTPRLIPLEGKTMLKHPTLDQFRQMWLDGMASKGLSRPHWGHGHPSPFIDLQTQDTSAELSHAEWLGLLVDREVASRNTRRFQARMRGTAAPHRGLHRRCRLPHPAQTGPGPVPATRHRALDR